MSFRNGVFAEGMALDAIAVPLHCGLGELPDLIEAVHLDQYVAARENSTGRDRSALEELQVLRTSFDSLVDPAH